MAEKFAGQWRIDDGRLCFTTSLERLKAMVSGGEEITVTFPNLHYDFGRPQAKSVAEVRGPVVAAWRIGGIPSAGWTANDLKALLHKQGCAQSGNKEQLLLRLANEAAKLYEKHAGKLDRCFGDCRFIRMAMVPKHAQEFPVLEDLDPDLANLLLTMYALKHLRGNAILDPNHENTSYTAQQLAIALLNNKTSLTRAFIKAG